MQKLINKLIFMYQIHFCECAVLYMHINHLQRHLESTSTRSSTECKSDRFGIFSDNGKCSKQVQIQYIYKSIFACLFRQPDLVLIFIFLIRFHEQFTRKLLRSISNFLANSGEENSSSREQFAVTTALAEEFRVFGDMLKT